MASMMAAASVAINVFMRGPRLGGWRVADI
jgi:hypothetical protein